MTQWIEVTNRHQDGRPRTRRINIPEIDREIWFTENGFAEVDDNVASALASNLDGIQEVAPPTNPGEYYGDPGKNETIRIVAFDDGEYDNLFVSGQLDAGEVDTDGIVLGDTSGSD